jgi:hypothetical protein
MLWSLSFTGTILHRVILMITGTILQSFLFLTGTILHRIHDEDNTQIICSLTQVLNLLSTYCELYKCVYCFICLKIMTVFCDDCVLWWSFSVREHVFHAIIKRLVDSRLTCPVLINNWLDQALLKHLDVFHGCKLYFSTGTFSMKKFCNLILHCRWVNIRFNSWGRQHANFLFTHSSP